MGDTATSETAADIRPPHESATLQVHTPDGLPGFPAAREWALDLRPDGAFGVLRHLGEPAIGLLVAEPWELAPGYEPDLPDDELGRIDVRDARDVLVLVVATITDGTTMVLNLAAPIALNVRAGSEQYGHARQAILDRQGWPLRHPVTIEG